MHSVLYFELALHFQNNCLVSNEKANTMLIFGVLRKTWLKLGICHSHEQTPTFSRTINVTVILILITCHVTAFISIVLEYKNKNWKVVFGSFFVTMSGLFNTISYLYFVCQKPKLLNFIDDLEKTVHESKCKNAI